MKYTVEQICRQYRENPKMKIIFFWGHSPTPGKITKACFSQWFDCRFEVDGVEYNTAEQYMMAQKALLFHDDEIYKRIMGAGGPHEYKKLGRMIRGFEQKLWDEEKYSIVLQGNIAKFGQNLKLKEYLLSTGDSVIVEASPYDAIWGVKMAMDDGRIQDPRNWQGENLLGFALMETRDQFQQPCD